MAEAAFDINEQHRLMLEEFPPTYERVDGQLVSKKLKGNVPVPPKWVRDRNDVPEGCEWATLAKELQNYYPEYVRDTLVDYVKDWPAISRLGTSLLLSGLVPERTLVWAGAAVMNEIVMRFGTFAQITTGWINSATIQRLLVMRERRDHEYLQWWTKLMNVKLLMVIDPHRILKSDDIHLGILYENRELKRLPTIAVVKRDFAKLGWDGLKKELGEFIADPMQETTENFIAQF